MYRRVTAGKINVKLGMIVRRAPQGARRAMVVSNGMTASPTRSARSPLLCMAALAAAAMLLLLAFGGTANLSLFYLYRQDRWLLLIGMILTALCLWRLTPRDTAFSGSWRLALFVGTLMAFTAFAGHYLILSGYDLSRDEQMATFDADVFARGSLVAPLSDIWRDHADALNTKFIYPANPRAAWISDYLPLNAALRALLGLIATPALTGPLMTLLGAPALWLCARRIWPEQREAAVVALLLYAGSAQVLLNGMTAYAMPAHLTLNLWWLWLFLWRRWQSDMAALMVGFIAVGLHQPLMHPMFAQPHPLSFAAGKKLGPGCPIFCLAMPQSACSGCGGRTGSRHSCRPTASCIRRATLAI
ncbi:hypothetical protein [Sphingopyxis sp. PET50]|uniref:hypothetical protein n=1 Tax=Sphingopyxis sp. PET50 TaxID=2976533 RepID=UPI0021AFFF19|nr:hypothetical protein [Sphingopyxis sp. PET50]